MKIKVWDIEVRVFHWALVAAFVAAFMTSRAEWLIEYHAVAGFAALVLVVFRVFWGFAGSRYARFSDFVKGWAEVRGFLSGVFRLKFERYLGHNPAVGWIILVMLASIAVITVTGVVTYGGEENKGMLAGVVSFAAGMYSHEVHELFAYSVLAMIFIHISAALFHDFVLKENIIVSMITGRKEDEHGWGEHARKVRETEKRPGLKLAAWLAVAALGTFGVIYLPPEGRHDGPPDEPFVMSPTGVPERLVMNAVVKEECSSCHNIFHPTLLPAASWKKVMAGLDDHFGDMVTLDPEAKREIEDFLVRNSAEASTTEASKKISYSIGASDPPDRVTMTPYWKFKHSQIQESVFKGKKVQSRSNCVACHPGAEAGSFEDKDIRVPKG